MVQIILRIVSIIQVFALPSKICAVCQPLNFNISCSYTVLVNSSTYRPLHSKISNSINVNAANLAIVVTNSYTAPDSRAK